MTSKRRVVDTCTPCYNEYVHAIMLLKQLKMMVMYNVIGARGRGVKT